MINTDLEVIEAGLRGPARRARGRRASRWARLLALLGIQLAGSWLAGGVALGAEDAQHAPAHAEHGAHEESPELNLFYGMFGERDDIETPNWMYRLPGTPVPLAAQVINSALLFALLYRFGKGPIQEGLKKRRDAIMQGIDQASKMKAEAEAQLKEREDKLTQIDAEITRIKREMRESAEAERAAILAEAKKRRERMEREAKILIEQELKAIRETVFAETVRAAVTNARQRISSSSNAQDDARLGDEFLNGLKQNLASVGQKSGQVGSAR
jgi:F-type H+-transporting ATPase subunit b